MGDLLAFRFNAFNPILDPWVFILFRKAIFQRLKVWFCCLCPRPDARSDLQTPLPQPATEGKDPRASPALGGKEGSWVPLPVWGEGQGAPLPLVQQPGSTVGVPSKAGSSAACPLC